jgi:PmbA protein
MLGEERCRALVERALAASKAEQTEIVLMGGANALTRFANSTIHQNVYESNLELRARLVVGKRIGAASTNDLSAAGLKDVLARAGSIAARQREDSDFTRLPEPSTIPQVSSFDAVTADYSPQARASRVKAVCDLAVEAGLVASGAFSTDTAELAVGNSLGVWAYSPSTRAHFKTVVTDSSASSSEPGAGEAAGYAERSSLRVDAIDVEALGREAVEKALCGRGATTVQPGEYQVVLEEYAVGELLSYLSYMGFGALALQEGHSFLSDRLGQKIMNEQITIWDDGTDPAGLPAGFDFEGVPKRKVSLIERGTAQGVVYDTRTAARARTSSTGHALPAPNTFGPFAWNLFMAAGPSSKEEMVGQVERGLWVTRFHYVNVLHSRQAILTGMTRDGTFLIEHGQVGRPVRNLRFTQNMLEALSDVRAVGSKLLAVEGFFGASVVPALLIDHFNFSGVSASEA